MVAEFVSPPNVEAQRNEPIISRVLVGHKPETQKNCMTSSCLFAPSHELLQNLTSLYNQICKLRVRCRLWHSRISLRLSLTQSQVRVPPYFFLCSLTFSFHEQSLFLCLNTASLLQELWAPPKRKMGLEDSSLNHYFLLALKIQDVNYSHMWVSQNSFRKMLIWVLVIYLCVIKMCRRNIEKELIFVFSTHFFTILWSTVYSSRPHSLDKF